MPLNSTSPWRFCVAPMLDWTDRHARMFMRQFSQHARLYTEMVTCGAIIHGDSHKHLQFHTKEHPVALQLGGAEPEPLIACAIKGQEYGYDEINLNVGCPSDRVQSGRFGACLMAEPQQVALCVKAMQAEVDIPITVKCRIGIDDLDSYQHLRGFVEQIQASGCQQLIVHARKAWLQGLSPKQNREIPPLDYERVYQLKKDFKDLTIVINGGIESLEACQQHLQQVDGVMLGRAAYHNPYLLSQVDQILFGDNRPVIKRSQALLNFIPYVDEQLSQGVYLSHISRHVLGLFQGIPGAKLYRRHISQHAHKARDRSSQVLLDALEQVLIHSPEV